MQTPPSPLDTLRQLKEMLDAGALTPTEFEALKQRLVFSEPPAAPPVPPAGPAASQPPVLPAEPAPSAVEAAASVLPVEHYTQFIEQPVTTPTASLPTAPLPTAPLPTAPLPTAPLPTAPLSTAPLPTAPLPTLPEPFTTPGQFQEPQVKPVVEWPSHEVTEADVPPARSSPLGLIIAIGAVLAFLAVVAYLSMNRPSSEHISSTSQTAADSQAAVIETGPQAAPLPPAVATAPETVRVAPAHPAPALPARAPATVRDSARFAPAPTVGDSATRP